MYSGGVTLAWVQADMAYLGQIECVFGYPDMERADRPSQAYCGDKTVQLPNQGIEVHGRPVLLV